MALDSDLIRQKHISPTGTPDQTVAPTAAPTPAPTPVPIGQSNGTTQTESSTSPEAKERANAAAADARKAHETAHNDAVEDTNSTKIAAIKQDVIELLKAAGKEGTDAEVYEYLQELKMAEQINGAQSQLLAEYEKAIEEGKFKPETKGQPSESSSDKTDVTKQTKKPVNEKYVNILKDENTNPKQKVENLLTEYYSKNDSEFSKLSKEEQKKFIEQKIKEHIAKLNPDKDNLSEKDLLKSYMSMALLVVEADKANTSLESFLNKPTEELNKIVSESKKEIFSYFIKKLENSDPKTVLKSSLRMYLNITDEEFASKSKKEQDKIIEAHEDEVIKHFGLKGTSQESKVMLKNMGINVLKCLSKKDISIENYVKMSSIEKDGILLEAAEKMYDKLPPKVQKEIDDYKVFHAACAAIGKGEHTYRELFEYLDKLNHDGKLSDEELNVYNQLKQDIKNGAYNPNEKVSLKSNLIKAIIANGVSNDADINVDTAMKKYAQTVIDQCKKQDGSIDFEKLNDLLIQGSNNDANVDWTNINIETLKEMGLSKKDCSRIMEMIDVKKVISHSDNSQGISTSKFSDFVQEFGSEDTINAAASVVKNIMPYRSDEFATDYLVNLQNDYNRIFTDAATSGINNDINRSDAVKANIYKAAFANAAPERRAIIAQSSIETASNELKLYYGEQFATIKDSSVTQGMAAAAQNETNPDIKSYLNNCVDYAVTHNGYSSNEIKSIKTAKETGKTSFERNVEAKSTNSAQSKSQTKTSTQQSAVTNPSTAQTSYSKSTVKLSAANSDLPKQLQQTLLQLLYQSSVAQREKAMQDLQNIIDKIQNDQQVRAQKQTEIKAQEASTDAEIAKATEAADAKSAQQQKADETKIAHEAKEHIGELKEAVEDKEEVVAKKFNISVDDVKTLREAHRQGDLNTIYTKLGSISVDAQKKFVQFVARKDTATIIGFIRNRSTDKSLIKELCKLNPGLIKSLDADLLLSCGIAKTDIIKYADSSQLSSMLASQARLGNTDLLNQFYEALGYSQEQIADAKSIIPGTSEWEKLTHNNAMAAPMGSTTVRSGNFPEGQTRQKIRPQDVDYREYLA